MFLLCFAFMINKLLLQRIGIHKSSCLPFVQQFIDVLERFSIECRKKSLKFCFTTLCDWFKKLAPPAQPIRCKTNRDLVARVFRAWRRSRVFASSSDWFIALFSFVVIGHRNCFGFGFTTHS